MASSRTTTMGPAFASRSRPDASPAATSRCPLPTIALSTPARASQTRNESEIHMSENSMSSSRSEEHTSELQSLMRISYAVFCLKKKKIQIQSNNTPHSDLNTHDTLTSITRINHITITM